MTDDPNSVAATKTWHLATCLDCEPLIPQPFTDPGNRTEWAGVHAEAVGHRVLLSKEDR